MPNRVIKESIWTSPNLNQLSDMAERHFYRLLPLPDDHGCCEVTSDVVKGRCYPLKQNITASMIEQWNKELENHDIFRTWEQDGRTYAWFPKWKDHQRIRALHQRKTPEPPSTAIIRRQMTTRDRLNPNLNPNLLPPSEESSKNPESTSPSTLTNLHQSQYPSQAPPIASRTHPRLAIFTDEYLRAKGKSYIVGNFREEGGAAKRTESKIPDENLFRQAVRAYLANTDKRLVENGHSFMWFIRELNRWVVTAQGEADGKRGKQQSGKYDGVCE